MRARRDPWYLFVIAPRGEAGVAMFWSLALISVGASLVFLAAAALLCITAARDAGDAP